VNWSVEGVVAVEEGAESERRSDDDRRAEDRRRSQEPIAWEDRRTTADRRLAERRAQVRKDYDQAVEDARAILLAHGMDSPEFVAAAKSTENLRRLSREVDDIPD
jgi:hypothetical protein